MMARPPVRVAVIGTGFMARMHAQAWRTAHRFFDLPGEPVLQLLAGRDADRTRQTADELGFAESTTRWEEAV